MDVSRVFQRSFKKTFKVFQKMFHVAWHLSQLPEQKEGLFMSLSFIFHKDPSFHYGDICKIILTFV